MPTAPAFASLTALADIRRLTADFTLHRPLSARLDTHVEPGALFPRNLCNGKWSIAK